MLWVLLQVGRLIELRFCSFYASFLLNFRK